MKLNLKTLKLSHGSHSTPEAGLCLMEAVAYFAGEAHSDAPACACPVLSKYGMGLNDAFTDDERELLKPFIRQLIGTRDEKAQRPRAEYLAHQAGTVFTPIALDACGLIELAASLRKIKMSDLKELENAASAACIAAGAAQSSAKSAARAAWSAACAACSAAQSSAKSAACSAACAAQSVDATKQARMKVVTAAIKAFEGAIKIGEVKGS